MIADLRRRGIPAPSLRLTSTTVLAGVFGTLVLVSLNAAMSGGASSGPLLLAFALCLVGFFVTQTLSLRAAARYTEACVRGFRTRLIEKLCASKLRVVEQISADTIFGVIERETKLISHVGLSLIAAAQSGAMVAFCLLYLLSVSASVALLLAALSAGFVALFVLKMRRAASNFHGAAEAENQLFALMHHVVYGFKEVKLHSRRKQALLGALERDLAEIERLRVTGEQQASMSLVLSRTALFLVVGVIVHLLPRLHAAVSLSAATLATTVLFMAGPLTNALSMVPVFARARASLRLLTDLDAQLEEAEHAEEAESGDSRFTSLELREVSYAYATDGAAGFAVGPLNLRIEAGTAVFVTGGNGSGKSTFLRLVTGLYQPTTGDIVLNGEKVAAPLGAAYRSKFAAVFWDYHLFDRFYGLDASHEDVERLLAHVNLQDKVTPQGDGLSTLELSTGQRRRLALVTALLEDRELYVFDEWAADQDPERRDWFYRQEIPRLLGQGKTVVVSTHDREYFHVCHQELRFDSGACIVIQRSSARSRALENPGRDTGCHENSAQPSWPACGNGG